MSSKPKPSLGGRRATVVAIALLLLLVVGCRDSAPANDERAEALPAAEPMDDSPVLALPASSPTLAQIVAATNAGPFLEFATTFDSFVDADDIQVTGVFDTASAQGYALHTNSSLQVERARDAMIWFDDGQLFVVDAALTGLRPAPGEAFDLMALGVESPAEPGIESALVTALQTDAALEVVGIEILAIGDSGETPLLHLQGSRPGKLDAVVTIDLWIDAENRIRRLTTTSTLPPDRYPEFTPKVRTVTIGYFSSPLPIPERPVLIGAQQVTPVDPDRGVPTSGDIIAATAAGPAIEFIREWRIGPIRLRSEGMLDLESNQAFAKSLYTEDGRGLEWLESSWSENGQDFVTTDGPDSPTRLASGDLTKMLADPSQDLQIDSFLVVGTETIDGQPVLYLIGSRFDISGDENLVQVWVDEQNRLVRLNTTIIDQRIAFPSSEALVEFRYPDSTPDIPPRP